MSSTHRPVAGRAGGLRRRWQAFSLVVALLLAAALPAAAEVTQNDIQAAVNEVGAARARLGAAQGELDDATRKLDRFDETLDRLQERIATQADAVAAQADEARARIARMYMVAGAGAAGLGTGDPESFPAQTAYLGALAEQDQEFVNELVAARADLVRLRGDVERQRADHLDEVTRLEDEVALRAAEVAEAEGRVDAVRAEYQRQEEERRRREEEARRRAEEAARREAEEQAAREAAAQAAMAAASDAAQDYGYRPGGGVEQWRFLVEKYFPASEVENAMKIMACESGGNPFALNPYSGASGLFQHLQHYWPSRAAKVGFAGESPFHPEANVAASAWLVAATDGWSHWTCNRVL